MACSPVQLLQLLRQDWYPDEEAAALAAQARARVLIFVKTLSMTKADLAKAAAKAREEHERAVMQLTPSTAAAAVAGAGDAAAEAACCRAVAMLEQLGLQQHSASFIREKITDDVVPGMTVDVLRQLGLPLGDAMRFMALLNQAAGSPSRIKKNQIAPVVTEDDRQPQHSGPQNKRCCSML